MSGTLALGASLRLLADLGIENIAATILDYTDRACQRLQMVGAKIVSDRALDHRAGGQRSGIVAFELPAIDPVAFRRHCLQRGIALSCRAGRLRISPHAYNNEEDLERLVDAIATFSN
jgi:selenocysteine lyase/cysteine desulfurase